MSCRIENGRAILPNGKDSKLLKDLRDAVGSNAEAEAIYESIYSKEFKNFYGFDFEKQDITQIEQYFNNLDENNEPRLFQGIGIYEFLNNKSKSFPVALSNKQKNKVLDLNRSEKENMQIQSALLNTLLGFANDIQTKVGYKMGGNLVSALKDKTLQAAFNSTITVEEAKDLYNTLTSGENGYDNFVKKIEDGNIELGQNWDVFISAYDQWDTKYDALGNIQTVGVFDLLRDSLSTQDMKLLDKSSLIEEIDEEFIRIYNMSRIQEDPKTKLSERAKALLTNIKVGTNILGYPETLPLARVVAILTEAAVSQPNFDAMVSKLDYYSEYKSEVQAITERLVGLNSGQKAAIFAAFKNTYKRFLLFKKEKQSDGTTKNLIINSNQSSVTKRSRQDFKNNSVEYITVNPRSPYKDVNGILEVKPEKLERIQNAWKVVKTAQNNRDLAEWSEGQIDALGTYLWELGMNYGPTLESTKENLKKYYELGNEEGVTKGYLLNDFAFGPKLNFGKLLLVLEKTPDKNFHIEQGTIIEKIAELSILFDSQPFGTFISGTNKAYYPINQPTSVDELIELINDPQQAEERKKYFADLETDPFFVPPTEFTPDTRYNSILFQVLKTSSKARKGFKNYTLDAYKTQNNVVDYEGQNNKASLIERMIGYANKDSDFAYSAIHIQADRPNLGFIQIPKMSALKKFNIALERKDIIEGLIIQDLARIAQANREIQNARKTNDTSKLIEGYHYNEGSNPYAGDGSVFRMTQIYGLEDIKTAEGTMSKLLEAFLNKTDKTEIRAFNKLLDQQVIYVENMLAEFEKEMKQTLLNFDVRLPVDVDASLNSNERQANFIKKFIFQEFVGRIEVTKFLRSGYSFAKNEADFYKRSGLLNTPGSKLAIQGFDQNDPQYGMMPQYNALVVRDFDYTDTEKSDAVVESLIKNGLEREIAEKYRSTNKSDAQSFISLDMYRGIMQGMGKWNSLDEQAYQEYLAGGDYNRPTIPLKPYHEQTNVKNGLSTMHMDKNSYMVVTPQLAKDFSYLQTMLDAFKQNGIHVVHTESATKGAKVNVQDFQGTGILDVSTPMVMDSSKLRFPQMIPTEEKGKVVFNRQIRKNIITNVLPNEMYTYEGKKIPGAMLQEMFGMAISENLEEDTSRVLKELGISQVAKIKDKETIEHKEAKLNHLKLLRSRIEQEIKDKELPQNYLDGLDIIPNGPFDYKFRIPLSFPNFTSKFETMVAGIFRKEIYNQKLKGIEAVQIAELGGHATSSEEDVRELQMYNGSNGGAEVRIKASTLGFTAEEVEGKIAADFEGDPRLEFIGYRIPQQGKSSAMVFKVVDFLPENYSKAIMVPGALTIQQGSDFDIDKLHLIFKEIGKLTAKQERNNIIYEVFKSILLDKKHLQEVMTPVSNDTLDRLAVSSKKINYNNPLSELQMESRNKVGIAGRGLWSNMLAGRNVAETLKVLNIDSNFAPTINGQKMSSIATVDLEGKYTDANISEYLSAAVDASKSPIQLDINDNVYTIPVAGLMLMTGVPITTVVEFLTQPAIVKLIENATIKSIPENKLLEAIDMKDGDITNMTFDSIKSIPDDRLLINFAKFYMAGKQLQRVNKIITPGNLDNLNEISSINNHLDTESFFLGSESLIKGAKDYILHQQGTSSPENHIGIAYRKVLDTIINNMNTLGFIQNSNAFKEAKEDIKQILQTDILSAGQHKFIDRALNLTIMTQPHSPLSDLLSRSVIENLYTKESPKNIVLRLREIGLQYPELNSNPFYRLLKEDSSNNETGITRIVLDTGTDLSTADKNEITNGLFMMLTHPEDKIRNFGKVLVANQFLTNGFSPTYGSYIDLIPSEVFTTDMLNPGVGSPVEFFEQEIQQLNSSNYLSFGNFTHEFVRNYGNRIVNKKPLLPTVKVERSQVVNGVISFTPENPRVFNDKKGYLQYFRTKDGTMYVFIGDATYQQLSPLGVPNKVLEVGTTNLENKSVFSFNLNAVNTERMPNEFYLTEKNEEIKDEDDIINKKC
jgi:hypothetical protein